MLILAPATCKAVVAFIVGAASVPVKVGLAKFAFKFKAVCVAVEIGLLASLVLSTLAKPTIVLVIPLTVPVKIGFAIGAYIRFADDVVK